MTEQRSHTERLPTWVVRFGACVNRYYTEYHARQMVDALRANGTPCTLAQESAPRSKSTYVGADPSLGIPGAAELTAGSAPISTFLTGEERDALIKFHREMAEKVGGWHAVRANDLERRHPLDKPIPCWCPYCGEPHSVAQRAERNRSDDQEIQS